MKKKIKFLVLVISLLFIFVGCGINNTYLDDVSITNPAKDKETIIQQVIKVTAVDAYSIFTSKYPEAKITEFQLDQDMGEYYYKIEAYQQYQKYEVKISAKDQTIFKDKSETKDRLNDDIGISKDDIEKAELLVKDSFDKGNPNLSLSEWSLETENKLLVLEVEIDNKDGQDIEITYDLILGEIIKIDD